MNIGESRKTRMTKPKKRKSEKLLTLPEAQKAWERFWSNTRILGFTEDEYGEKQAIRTDVQRIMPENYGSLNFTNKKK